MKSESPNITKPAKRGKFRNFDTSFEVPDKLGLQDPTSHTHRLTA